MTSTIPVKMHADPARSNEVQRGSWPDVAEPPGSVQERRRSQQPSEQDKKKQKAVCRMSDQPHDHVRPPISGETSRNVQHSAHWQGPTLQEYLVRHPTPWRLDSTLPDAMLDANDHLVAIIGIAASTPPVAQLVASLFLQAPLLRLACEHLVECWAEIAEQVTDSSTTEAEPLIATSSHSETAHTRLAAIVEEAVEAILVLPTENF